MSRARALTLAGVAGCLAVALAAPTSQAASTENLQEVAPVTTIIDGDTVWVELAGQEQSVRLLGVQAMEAYHPSAPDTTFDACHAAAAREELASLVSGKTVQLWSKSASSENRGRLLRSVMVPENGTSVDVQRELLADSLVLPLPSPDEPAHNAEYMTLAQQVSKAGAGIWDTDACGSGPAQTVPLKVIVNYDAPGDDTTDVNGEWVSIQNLSTERAINLRGWWVRDSSLSMYTFHGDTVVPAGGRVNVRVGKGKDTSTGKYWGLSAPVFDNTGDGAYLFDPDGDLRAWMMYPCLTGCSDPELGNLVVTAVQYNPPGADATHVTDEWIKIENTSTHRIGLRPYVLRSAPYSYTFSPTAAVDPGHVVVVRVGKGTDTTRRKYWGLSKPILGNSGDKVRLMTYDDILLSCKAWGTVSC